MPKHYDETMKKFFGANPKDFTDWLFAGTEFEDVLPTELQSRDIFVDALCRVRLNGKPFVLHIEFQRNIRAGIPDRLLEYNVLASRVHQLRVYSCVIYLVDDGEIDESPLIWRLPDGSELLKFHYQSVRIWEVDPQEFTRPGREGLLPLVLLTKGNAYPENFDRVTEQLIASDKLDLVPVTCTLASLVFKGNAVFSEHLARSVAVLQDILKDTPAYQQMMQMAREDVLQMMQMAREDVLQEGRQEGELLTRQETLISFIQVRFPELVPLANKYIEEIKDSEVLQQLLVKLFSAQTDEEVTQLLFDASKEKN